jgi:4-diphosphocytidyl-2-C-methyl-D-erythritol kinase
MTILSCARRGDSFDDPRLIEAARATGADVPVCLAPSARMMRGAGENIGERLNLPPSPAVLINPAVPVETRAVFARLGLAPGERSANPSHPTIDPKMSADALCEALKKGRNDLEDAACVDAPVIVDVLAILSGARGCRLARMSGSGATCFALFATPRAALRAAAVARAQHPEWWVKTALLR